MPVGVSLYTATGNRYDSDGDDALCSTFVLQGGPCSRDEIVVMQNSAYITEVGSTIVYTCDSTNHGKDMMRKWLAFLIAAMLLALCACSGTDTSAPTDGSHALQGDDSGNDTAEV